LGLSEHQDAAILKGGQEDVKTYQKIKEENRRIAPRLHLFLHQNLPLLKGYQNREFTPKNGTFLVHPYQNNGDRDKIRNI